MLACLLKCLLACLPACSLACLPEKPLDSLEYCWNSLFEESHILTHDVLTPWAPVGAENPENKIHILRSLLTIIDSLK